MDGNLDVEIQNQLEILELKFKENGCSDFKIAKDAKESADLWFARKNASQSITIYGSKKLNEDITVPRNRLPQLLAAVNEISKKYDVKVPCFGHTGDGNVHTNVMVDGSDPAQLEIGHKAIVEIFQATIDLGGTLSGEHGIGLSKAPFMHMAFTDGEMDLFLSLIHI